MGSEIQYRHDDTGETLYAVLTNDAGQYWDTAGGAFASLGATWGDYDIALSEDGNGYQYGGDMPAAGAAWLTLLVFRQLGGAPAAADPLLASWRWYWTGTAWAVNVPTDVDLSSLNDLSQAEAQAAAAAALAAYDPPTKAELDSAVTAIRGSEGDDLDDISDQLDGLAGGAGTTTWTLTVEDGDGNPLDGVRCWLTSDEAGSNVVASGTTNASGEASFLLDDGTYYLWKELAGYNFTNPETVTVG